MNGNRSLHREGELPFPSPAQSVRFFSFVEGGVLFLEGTRRLWVLNSSSAFLWCLLDSVQTSDELAGHLAARFALDLFTARQAVAGMLSALAQEGLLADGVAPPPDPEERSPGAEADGPLLVEPASWAVSFSFRTPQHNFEFSCQDLSLGAEFATLLAHLPPPLAAPVHSRLAVLADGQSSDSWGIFLDGRRFCSGIAREEVLPYLFTLVFIRASGALADKLLFHAAVLGSDGRAVLFPAEAGCGKTTLAAALAARGKRFYSDELAVLDRSTLRLLPLPLPMSIKPGSLSVLERYYPGLSASSVHPRCDGKIVRYLPPPPHSLGVGDRCGTTVEALVFPRYRPAAPARLAALDKPEALQRLAETGSSDRDLRAADVEAMVRLVERHPCFVFEHSDLAEGIHLLEASFPSLASGVGVVKAV